MSGYYDLQGNKVQRTELEIKILESNFRCPEECRCQRPGMFPAPCQVDNYKTLIEDHMIDALLSNYRWVREMAKEIGNENNR